MALGQRSQALLTILYCSTDCLRRCGAAVQNLSHSASFHCLENNAPSNPGIKHLVVLRTVRVATTDLCAGCQQSFARDIINLQSRAVRILEQYRVVSGGKIVLSRCVNDVCADLYKEVIRLVDVGTFSRTKTVVM